MKKATWVKTMIEVNDYLMKEGITTKDLRKEVINCPVNGLTIPDTKPKQEKK